MIMLPNDPPLEGFLKACRNIFDRIVNMALLSPIVSTTFSMTFDFIAAVATRFCGR